MKKSLKIVFSIVTMGTLFLTACTEENNTNTIESEYPTDNSFGEDEVIDSPTPNNQDTPLEGREHKYTFTYFYKGLNDVNLIKTYPEENILSDGTTEKVYVDASEAPTLETIDNYYFVGWYLNGGIELSTITESTEITSQELYAQYLVYEEYDTYVEITDIATPFQSTSTEYITLGGNYILPVEINGKPVTSIAQDAFEDAIYLKGITLTDNITTVDIEAFKDCSSLETINISKSVTYLNGAAFSGCNKLNRINVDENNTKFRTMYNNILVDKNDIYSVVYSCPGATLPATINSIKEYCYYGATWINSISYGLTEVPSGTLNLPSSIVSINSSTFSNCTSLTDVTLPASISEISDFAFQGCKYLNSFTINSTVTMNGSKVFDGCTNLRSVAVIGQARSICQYAFYNLNSIKSVHIGDNVTTSYEDSFYNCSSITTVIYDNYLSKWNRIVFKGETSNPLYYAGGSIAFSFTVSNPNQTQAGLITYDSSNLNFILSGDDVNAFALSGLAKITSLNYDSEYNGSFNGYAFAHWKNLTNLFIAAGVDSIASTAFYDCEELTRITVSESNPIYDSRNDCNAIVETSSNTLIKGCRTTVIPSSVKSIGNYAFDHAIYMEEISIPSDVTSIGQFGFYNCRALTTLSLNNADVVIGTDAFKECTKIKTINYAGTEEEWNNLSGTAQLKEYLLANEGTVNFNA